MTRYSFDTVISITAGCEEEHWATVTGEYIPAARAPLNGGYSDEEPEPASFYLETLTITVDGKTRDFLPFLTHAQVDAIEREGVADYECLPPSRTAALSRAMGGVLRPVKL